MPIQWTTLLVVILLLFWAVGARNRLVSMRNEIGRCFASVQTQAQQRQLLLMAWMEGMRPLLGSDGAPTPALDSVQAAAQQVITACERLQTQPAAAQPATSLRMAEETLVAARQRLQASLPSPTEPDPLSPSALVTESLAAADGALAFARHQFNNATQAYNEALMQFPTWVIAGLFSFRAAGTL